MLGFASTDQVKIYVRRFAQKADIKLPNLRPRVRARSEASVDIPYEHTRPPKVNCFTIQELMKRVERV